jgi:hypothetical protein
MFSSLVKVFVGEMVDKNIKTAYEEKFIFCVAACFAISNNSTSKTCKCISAESYAAKAFYG